MWTDLQRRGVRLWLMGGWGVDALLGRQTREHHDVDVLVEAESLEPFVRRLDALGYALAYVWDDETWWVGERPTAFVHAHPDGREVDVHTVRVTGGEVETLGTLPYAFTAEGLRGRGVVGGVPVNCLTAEMQRAAHTGYDLPPHHEADLRLLAALGGETGGAG